MAILPSLFLLYKQEKKKKEKKGKKEKGYFGLVLRVSEDGTNLLFAVSKLAFGTISAASRLSERFAQLSLVSVWGVNDYDDVLYYKKTKGYY